MHTWWHESAIIWSHHYESFPCLSNQPHLDFHEALKLCALKRILKSFFTIIWQWLSAHTQLINLVTRWEHSSLSYKVISHGVHRRHRFLALFYCLVQHHLKCIVLKHVFSSLTQFSASQAAPRNDPKIPARAWRHWHEDTRWGEKIDGMNHNCHEKMWPA